ncbi:Helitron helicase [Phytophthora megakarya]|uniref:Helitron helicase n=1 Tax=Phytophthora megakarya TaxID=4795 RepID=A0A225WRD1_9STRA|nr:Helitron helicase [Phytophthora megakarya]
MLLFFRDACIRWDALMLLYYEFPRHYTWVPADKNRERRTQSGEKVLPYDSDRFNLRMLLLHHSNIFELLTGHFTIYFKLLHKQYDYWRLVINAPLYRRNKPAPDAKATTSSYCNYFGALPPHFSKVAMGCALECNCLCGNNKVIKDFNGLHKLSAFSDLHTNSSEINRLIQTKLGYGRTAIEGLRNKAVFDTVIDGVRDDNTDKRLFFLDGPVRLDGKIDQVATELKGGRTAHYNFQLSLDLSSSSTCNVAARSNQAELLRQASDITGFDENDKPFGGKGGLPAGDFRVILPIIHHGPPSEAVKSSIKRS